MFKQSLYGGRGCHKSPGKVNNRGSCPFFSPVVLIQGSGIDNSTESCIVVMLGICEHSRHKTMDPASRCNGDRLICHMVKYLRGLKTLSQNGTRPFGGFMEPLASRTRGLTDTMGTVTVKQGPLKWLLWLADEGEGEAV